LIAQVSAFCIVSYSRSIPISTVRSTQILTVFLFQVPRNGDWKSLRSRHRGYLVGRRTLCRQRDVDSWLSSPRLGC